MFTVQVWIPSTEDTEKYHGCKFQADTEGKSRLSGTIKYLGKPYSLKRFFHLNETGKMDEETRASMKLPRCGRADLFRNKRQGY